MTIKNLFSILLISLFIFSCDDSKKHKKEESLKTFLNGCWKRVESTYFGKTNIDSDNYYTLYTIYNDTSSVFYSFRYTDESQYILENHLISFIDYQNNSVKRNRGKVIKGFEGWYSDEFTWKDIVESNKGEVFPITRLSDNKFKVIFPGEDYNNEEIYLRLNEDDIPVYLKEILYEKEKPYNKKQSQTVE